MTKAGGQGYSYQPLTGSGPAKPTPFAANGNLDYHGGPVMPAVHQYAIFWAPSGFSFPAGYQSGITEYLQNLAADSGKATNTTSVGAQYTDAFGNRANYNVTFEAAINDTDPYPSSGCLPYTGLGATPASFSRCLTDDQLQAEIDSFVGSHGNQRGLTNIYFLFLPNGVGNCFDNANHACFDHEYCAYHSNFNSPGGQTIYTNESFAPVDPAGCGTGNYPNDKASGIDDELSSLSHETNEAREDPLVGTGNYGWFNSNTGDEGADQCRNTANDYGPLLGGTPGVDGFNQIINGGHYILQMDWSNAHNGCEQRYNLTGTANGPASGQVGQPLTFTASGADADGGSVTGVTINFGDGTSASGTSASHTYVAAGTYQVTATITNSIGLTATATGPRVTVTKPPPPPNAFTFGRVERNTQNGTATLPVTVPSAGTLTLGGKGVRPIHKAKAQAKAVNAGTTTLKVRAKGRAARKLSRTGKARVTAKITYTPAGGKPNTERKRIRLKREG